MNNRAEGINFIRIFCMLSILLFHARTYYGFIIGVARVDEFISIGAVTIVGFFMMSGFCLRMQWRNIDIMSEAGGYFRKRLAGIYPSFLFLLLCTFIFNYRLGPDWQNILKVLPIELSLLQVIFEPLLNDYFFNGNFWFISALFVLYLLFPYLNKIADCINGKERRLLCIILPIFSWYIYYLNIYIMPGNSVLFFYTNPFFRIPEFFVGVLISDIANEQKHRIRLWHWAGATILAEAAIHILYAYLAIYSFNMYNIILIPYFSFLLLATGTMKRGTMVDRIASNRVVKYIASLGLGVYLCQSLSIMVLEKGWVNIPCRADLTFIVMTIVFVVFLHEGIEKPGKKLLLSLGRRKEIHERK